MARVSREAEDAYLLELTEQRGWDVLLGMIEARKSSAQSFIQRPILSYNGTLHPTAIALTKEAEAAVITALEALVVEIEAAALRAREAQDLT